jgi:CheY-like chemotaxis protein/anti-sigma regulatory factor (Ser/Thr protein kinase)
VEQLLGDLLDVTRLDTGVVKPSLGVVRIDDILRPLAREMAVVAEGHGLSLRHVACGATVATDAVLLRRILQNLLGNALRYTARGRVLVGCRRNGDRLRIEIWDTGPGIPSEKQVEIFQEFRQLDTAPGDRDKGLGLGLSIVERLAAILGHRVSLRSSPGRGSCFAVEVPMAVAEVVARRVTPQVQGAGFGGILVLCIENEIAIAEAMTALLSGWSCEVVWGTTADAAMAALGERRPDIVLTDYHLDHGLNGLDVLAGLRARFGSGLPAAVITADRDAAVRQAAEAADCHIAYKPLRPGALRALIAHLVTRSRSLSDDAAATAADIAAD